MWMTMNIHTASSIQSDNFRKVCICGAYIGLLLADRDLAIANLVREGGRDTNEFVRMYGEPIWERDWFAAFW